MLAEVRTMSLFLYVGWCVRIWSLSQWSLLTCCGLFRYETTELVVDGNMSPQISPFSVREGEMRDLGRKRHFLSYI